MKKIMFNDRYGLTQAVLCGRKTQTRRELKSGINVNSYSDLLKLSPYKVVEVVAVAQSYRDAGVVVVGDEAYGQDMYAPIYASSTAGWSNKMFVKAELMPHHIKITNVRIEHLQDISDKDCIKEGLEFLNGNFYVNYNKITHARIWIGYTTQEAFAALIDKISGNGTWERNPLVWVYDFDCPEKQEVAMRDAQAFLHTKIY